MSDDVRQFRMLIDGRLVQGQGAPLEILNPATEEVVARVPDATDDQLAVAVDAAGRAFATWRSVPLAERRRVVRAIGGSVQENVDELAALLTSEQGKPLSAARKEVEGVATWCDWLAECEFPEEEIREDDTHRLRIRHVPLGVVAAIAPWNFPVALAIRKIGPALLTGNTVVVKPSPFTPLTMLRFGELVQDIVPPGVVNVISGGDSLGPRLTSHQGIQKFAFTGATATGKKVMDAAARQLARVTLELGGNDAAVILPDVDLDSVADAVFESCFRNSGQVCVGTKRVYVHDDIYDEFAKRLVGVTVQARVGNGMDEGVTLGPVQNDVQYRRIIQLIEDCERSGLDFLLKGEVPDGPGYFIHPTILDNPPEDAAIVTEEQFGPVVPLLRFRDIDDVVARVNDSEYGLGGSVWGRDLEAASRVAERIESGLVWVNEAQRVLPSFPMAGHKASGIGSENGIEGLLQYTSPQVLSLRKA
ncbi:aldehyde dehydrogenase family protein [Streptomyces sp. NPDC005077]|uniref:aldehyde dehydrogenase family protein n=1 Tax=Streptomyces sp. NPDC005077 TaxID=3154292 RepID=UPI0033B07ACD